MIDAAVGLRTTVGHGYRERYNTRPVQVNTDNALMFTVIYKNCMSIINIQRFLLKKCHHAQACTIPNGGLKVPVISFQEIY